MGRRRAGSARFLAAIGVAALVGTCGIAMAAAQTASSARQSATALYKDPSASVEARVEDLLKRMTLEEKAAQLVTLWEQKAKVQTDAGVFSPEEASQNFPNGIGQFARAVLPRRTRVLPVLLPEASTATPATLRNTSMRLSAGRSSVPGSAFRS